MSTQSIQTIWSDNGMHEAQTLKLDGERVSQCLERHIRNMASETNEGDAAGSGTALVTTWVSGGKEFTVTTYPKPGETTGPGSAHETRHNALVNAGKLDWPEDP